MDRHTVDVLDFPRVLEFLAGGAQSPQGADLCRSLLPRTRQEEADLALGELEALSELESSAGFPPTAGLHRIEEALDTARIEGACLEAEVLLQFRDTLDTCHSLLAYLEDAADEGSPLARYVDEMVPLHSLGDRFHATFGPRGEFLDSASSTLQSIRADVRRMRERILRTLEGILHKADLEPAVQDDFITRRGERYVIPMRTDFRGYLEGIIHDRSRTGATFFVEPLAVVELNNQLSLLRKEEDAEVRRILAELTSWVGREARSILRNVSVAAHFDALGARLRLARRLRCVRPQLVAEPCVELRGARHPLLEWQLGGGVVPVDIVLGGETRILLVTGANAGGKTVALKTAGLLTLMARAGLFIPAEEGSRLGWFRDVCADIGDEQDIDRSLSTFSAHVVHLRDILERAGERTLVLLDELGTGTDPNEGAALSQAVLEALAGAGASVLGTTHLAGLKAFVYARSDAQNAAVAFDAESGRPLFRLVYGHGGTSNALDVAERLGFPAGVIARAREYAHAGSDATADLLRGIDQVRRAAAEAAEKAQELSREWERRLAAQKELLDAARHERDAAKAEAKKEATAAIEGARAELRRTIADFARRAVTQQAAEQAVRAEEQRLEDALRPEMAAPAPDSELREVSVGLRVFVPSLGAEGVVEALDADGRRALVRVGAVRTTVARADLRESRGAEPSRKASGSPLGFQREEGAYGDLVVLGCTVEEALERVDRAVDRALMAGADGFRIIHGRGTGALRRGIREHLAASPQVRSVEPVQGDEAVTWVELR